MFNYYDKSIYDGDEYYNISGHYNFPTDKNSITVLFILRGRVLNDNIIEEFKDSITKVKLKGMHK